MAVADSAKPVALAAEHYQSRSLLQDSIRRLFRNKGAIAAMGFIVFLAFLAIFADAMVGWGWIDYYTRQHRGSTLARPLECSVDVDQDKDGTPDAVQFCFLSGADDLGRDILSRVVYGSRVSLLVAVVGSSVSMLIGTVYGIVSGFYGGRVDQLMMRFVDFLYGIPTLPMIIIMQVYFRGLRERSSEMGPFAQSLVNLDRSMGGLLFLFIALGMLSWIGMARLARGQVLSYKQKEFVEAARMVGAGNRRMGPLVVSEAMSIPGYIFAEASLSFLGLGVNPPTPSWGEMITSGVGGLRYYQHLLILPGLMLSLTTLAFNFLGDGLRDALDPRMIGEE
jgi:oligopeptide transport system permease protein